MLQADREVIPVTARHGGDENNCGVRGDVDGHAQGSEPVRVVGEAEVARALSD